MFHQKESQSPAAQPFKRARRAGKILSPLVLLAGMLGMNSLPETLPTAFAQSSGNVDVHDPGFIDRTNQTFKLNEKARNLQNDRRFDEAAAVYAQAIKLDPNGNSAMVHNNYASLLDSQNQLEQAVKEYETALSIDPSLELAKRNLDSSKIRFYTAEGKRFKGEHNYDDSVKAYQNALDLDKSRAMSWNNLGTGFQAKGDLEKAVQAYKEALTRQPDMELATINIARSYLNMGDFGQAKIYFSKYVEQHPNSQDSKEARDSLETMEHNPSAATASDVDAPDYLKSATAQQHLRWPKNAPIRVFIAPGQNVNGYQPGFRMVLMQAFDQWTTAAQRKITWTLTPNESDANIVCTWAENNVNFKTKEKTPDAQGEVSSYESFVRDGERLIRHTSIVIATFNEITGKLLTVPEAKDVCLHEVGHALGLVGHSPNYHDVMFFITNPGGGANNRDLSARDIATINRLYSDYPSRP